ncbi:MAG: repair protein RadC [Sphingomonadales bacterium]|jgi:DNA repair protein RadC|nr:repair protein RadC [Sphingomonadales bacterium]
MVVATARDAAKLLGPLFLDLGGEKLALLYLDGGRRVIAVDSHPVVERDEIVLPMAEIFRAALNHKAAGLIVAHNHPSGDPTPSRADIAATRRLAETAANLGLVLHDHLIFAGGECRSFRELGLL